MARDTVAALLRRASEATFGKLAQLKIGCIFNCGSHMYTRTCTHVAVQLIMYSVCSHCSMVIDPSYHCLSYRLPHSYHHSWNSTKQDYAAARPSTLTAA